MGKPTSEEPRKEAEELRQTAIKLMTQAAKVIEKSAALEKEIGQVAEGRNRKQGKPVMK
jgi:hypothetical protein